jgi:hypothetical protein
MNASATPIPLSCNPHALSATEWAAHQATSARLFTEFRKSGEALSDGDAFHFPAGAFALVAAFVEAERRCCPERPPSSCVSREARKHAPSLQPNCRYHSKKDSSR